MNFKHSILLIFIALFTFSCSLWRKCPEVAKITVEDSVITKLEVITKDSIVYRTIYLYSDTTVTDTIYKTIYGFKYNDTLSIYGNIADAHAWIYNNKLMLRLHERDSTLKFKLDSVIRLYNKTKDNFKTITIHTEPIIKVENSSFAHFCIWGFCLLIFVIILRFILKRYKFF